MMGPRVNSSESDLAGTTSSLKTSFKPSATGASKPNGPIYSGPIRCCAAAEIFRSNHTHTNTPTVEPIIIKIIGSGIQMTLATSAGSPKSIRVSIKVPCRSIPEFMLCTQ